MSTPGLSWKSVPARERLFSRLTIDPSGCLLWTGAQASVGYGQIMINRRNEYVHRVMYRLFVGPIPDGMVLDHLCRVPLCANPAHLEAVSQRTNVLRGGAPAALNAAKTHCFRGHPFTPENTVTDGRRRRCRACDLPSRADR